MNLHENPEVFLELLQAAAEFIGLPQVYVEKDYWVTKALKQLSQSDCATLIVFKGGTSLSKAFRLIDRFSEDIDLAIYAAGYSDIQRKKQMKQVEVTATQGLHLLKNDVRESKGSRFRRTVYEYPRLNIDLGFGQASPQLIIEINTFTSPEPFEQRLLQTFIADFLTAIGQTELISQFGLGSFSINVLSVKRTLIEKILGIIKDSYSDRPVTTLTNRIRHLYDVCMILRNQKYKDFLATEECKALFRNCIEEEINIFGDPKEYFQNPLSEAPIFSQIEDWRPSLQVTYAGVFSSLVYGRLPDMAEIVATFTTIKHILISNSV